MVIKVRVWHSLTIAEKITALDLAVRRTQNKLKLKGDN